MAAFKRGDLAFSTLLFAIAGLVGACGTSNDLVGAGAGQNAPGAACTAAGDCKSGSCFAGVCQGGSVPSGGSCTTGGDCQSGNCVAGKCQGGGAPVGGGCTS